MARYIKKFSRVGSLGPTEERGFKLAVELDVKLPSKTARVTSRRQDS